jgi:outer membrane protein, multidrug efflux system
MRFSLFTSIYPVLFLLSACGGSVSPLLPKAPASLNQEITGAEIAEWMQDGPPPKSLEIPKEPSVGIPVLLEPITIRRMLLEGNTSIILGANRIHQAREQLNIARGGLLPSLNISTLLLGSQVGLGAAEFLLPFLLPSKWFESFKAKNMVEAEKAAYLILELNQYASALTLYFTHHYDLSAREEQLEEVKQFERMQKSAQTAYGLGLIAKDELDQAKAQTAIARIRVTRLNDLIVHERALIRHSLGLELNRSLEMKRMSLSSMPEESKSAQELIDQALAIAPERTQLLYLMKAAENEKWAKIFGFVNIFSLANRFLNGNEGGFTGLQASSNMSLGFGTIPSIKLSNKNKENLQIQEQELKFQVSEILERSVHQLTIAKTRLDEAIEAEKSLSSAFEAKLKRFELGTTDLTAVSFARTQLREAMLERLRTESEINSLRVALQRAFIQDEFSKIRGCNLSAQAEAKKDRIFFLSWFKDLFTGSSNDWLSVERICSGAT